LTARRQHRQQPLRRLTGLVVRTTGPEDHRALALLRALWTSGAPDAEDRYRRASFIVPDESAGDDRLLVRPRPF
jgi:hypothetical protein